MNSLILRYFLIELVRIFDRAVFHTGSTTSAFALYNISGFFNQRYLEVSRFTGYTVNFGIAQDLDVGMPADLDQFGREYSHGTVIGGKGFVKLGHMSADGGRFLDKINLKPGDGEIKRGLNTADSSADNHDISEITLRESFTKLLNLFFFHFYPPLSDLMVL